MSNNSYNVAVIHGNEMRGAPKKVANLIWFFVYGLWYGIGTIFMGIGYCCTLIFIPMGIQFFKLLKLVFMPFGKDVVTHFGRRGFLNVCWNIFAFGWLSFLYMKLLALILKITVFAYPVGVQLDKFARFWLAPFGAEILSENEYSIYREDNRDIQLIFRHAVANPDVELNTAEGKMPLRKYMEQKKPEVEYLAQKVILSKKLMIFGIILAVLGLVVAIFGILGSNAEPGTTFAGIKQVAPILGYVGWPLFALGMLMFVWRLVMILTKLQVKRYQGMKGFLASGFDDKINVVVYRRCFKGLVNSYADINGLVTKKEKTGNVRYLYNELGDDLDLMQHIKQPEPQRNPNSITVVAAGVAAAPMAEPAPAPAAPQKDNFEDLKKLKDLKDAGIITEEEYEQKKSEILGKI